MEEVSIIGVDLAKNVFQLHGAASDGSVVFRKKLLRPQFARFMADHPACEVAMEACLSAHHWARELTGHGHRVRLIAPHYVKPFLKRQKNDAADAEAIAEAATRPTMRFVECRVVINCGSLRVDGPSVDDIANAQMGKRRRMRWSPKGAHRVAVTRAAVLDGRLNVVNSKRAA